MTTGAATKGGSMRDESMKSLSISGLFRYTRLRVHVVLSSASFRLVATAVKTVTIIFFASYVHFQCHLLVGAVLPFVTGAGEYRFDGAGLKTAPASSHSQLCRIAAASALLPRQVVVQRLDKEIGRHEVP